MYQGSCLCGLVSYQISAEPEVVINCHCKMCQKHHAAAFSTYACVKSNEFEYLSGEDDLKSYNSSSTINRKFCSQCGSTIEWSGSQEAPDHVAISLATFDTEFIPKKMTDANLDSKCKWLLLK